jgi:hypothetical protein
VYVYAISSGAALALATAAAGTEITKLALYEPPFMAEIEDGTRIKEYTKRLHELLDAGHKSDAVALFMTHVGVPAQVVAGIRAQPGWEMLEAIAPTLAYDDEVLAGGSVPRDLAATIAIPALVLAGGASPKGFNRRRRPPRTHCPPQRTERSTARHTTWPPTHSHLYWPNSSSPDHAPARAPQK